MIGGNAKDIMQTSVHVMCDCYTETVRAIGGIKSTPSSNGQNVDFHRKKYLSHLI
jgi:hypothetical protein